MLLSPLVYTKPRLLALYPLWFLDLKLFPEFLYTLRIGRISQFVKHTDGKWYYVQSGKVNFAKTGLVKHTDGKYYYVQSGKINFAKTGLVKHTNGKYYYVEKGVVNTSKNGRVKHTNGKYYTVKNGVVV